MSCHLHAFDSSVVIPVQCGQKAGIPVQCGQRVSIPVQCGHRASIPVHCEQMVTADVAQDAQIKRAEGFWVLGLGP